MRRDETMKRTMQKLREDSKIIPANVTEDDVKEAFERSRTSLPHRPASVTFRQIVIAPKPTPAAKEIARAKAESILAEIKRGGDFALLAKRESMDPTTKETGGDLGWARRGQYVAEFERWVWSLPPGELSQVFESPFGYHIVRVDRVAGGEYDLKDMMQLIRNRLAEEGGVRRYLDSLRKRAYVSIRLDQAPTGTGSSQR